MSLRKNRLRHGAAAMMIACSACTYSRPTDLSPNVMRALVIPTVGQTAAAVVEQNGEPDRREQTDGVDLWVYSRIVPEGAGLRSKAAVVRLREGVVVDVDTTVGGLYVPTPTFPPAR